MGRLQIYVFRQLVWWTLLVASSLTCIVWLTQSLRFVEMIVNRGLSASTFFYFTLLLLPTFLTLIAPIALFVAAMFVYNKMISDSELVVMRAAGVGPGAIARPAIVFALLLTAFGYLNSLYLMPTSYREFKNLQRSFRSEFSSVLLQEGVFNPVADGITVFIRERTNDGELYGIIIHDERVPDKPITMMAERGAIVGSPNGPRVVMANGNRQEIRDIEGRLSVLYFDRYTFDLKSIEESTDALWREPRERYLGELLFPASQEKEIFNYHKLRMEGYHRLTSPLLHLAFLMVGLALLLRGDFNRRGQLYQIMTAVVIVIGLQIAMLAVKNAGEKAPWIAPLTWLIPTAAIGLGTFATLSSWRPRRRRSGTTETV